MFYLEVMLESTGGVKDVRIHHEGKVEQQVSVYRVVIIVLEQLIASISELLLGFVFRHFTADVI
jgi:hypothetical protein